MLNEEEREEKGVKSFFSDFQKFDKQQLESRMVILDNVFVK